MSHNVNDYKYHLSNTYSKEQLVFGKTKLWQIGRLYCKPDTVIESHLHPDLFELTVVTSGRGRISANGVFKEVRPGDVFLSFPREYHEIISEAEDPLRFDFFAFATTDKDISASLAKIISERESSEQRVFRDSNVTSLITDALAELEGNGEYSERMLESILQQIVIRTVRAFSNMESPKRKGHATDAEALCYQVMKYIDTHVYSIDSLSEVTEAMNYNYSYVSDLFKRTTGQTLNGYYRTKRLEIAKGLLSEGETNISRISEMLNYSSVFTFSRAFKSLYGVSPKQYKKENKSV